MRMRVRHKDLKEIVEAIRDYFEKAAVAGEQLSEMLEISKEQLDRSFSQLRSESPSSFPFFIFEILVFGYSEIAGKILNQFVECNRNSDILMLNSFVWFLRKCGKV